MSLLPGPAPSRALIPHRVVDAVALPVTDRQMDARADVLGNLLQVRFEGGDPALPEVLEPIFLAERVQGIGDRDVCVEILAAALDSGVGDRGDLLVAPRGELGGGNVP